MLPVSESTGMILAAEYYIPSPSAAPVDARTSLGNRESDPPVSFGGISRTPIPIRNQETVPKQEIFKSVSRLPGVLGKPNPRAVCPRALQAKNRFMLIPPTPCESEMHTMAQMSR